jgi:GNAT superfamily N-acetyltransferase
MIRRCGDHDFELIWTIVNDGARAYQGVIPADRWHDPYMSTAELREKIEDGVVFWGYEESGTLQGVMGLQAVEDITLIRHAYVRTGVQKQGIGTSLLAHLESLSTTPVLIGTWADAIWAIRFYEKHGYQLVPSGQKDQLLRRYWRVPERQIDTSVVLADERWRRRNSQPA